MVNNFSPGLPGEQSPISVGVTAPFQTGNTAVFHKLTRQLVENIQPAFVSVAHINRFTHEAHDQLLTEMAEYCRDVPVIPHLAWWWRNAESMAEIFAMYAARSDVKTILMSPPGTALRGGRNSRHTERSMPSLIHLAQEAGGFSTGVCLNPYLRNRGELNRMAAELEAADFAIAGPTYSIPVHSALLQSLHKRQIIKPVIPSLEVGTTRFSVGQAEKARLGRLLLRRQTGLHIYTHGYSTEAIALVERILT